MKIVYHTCACDDVSIAGAMHAGVDVADLMNLAGRAGVRIRALAVELSTVVVRTEAQIVQLTHMKNGVVDTEVRAHLHVHTRNWSDDSMRRSMTWYSHAEASVLTDESAVATHGVAAVAGCRRAVRVHVARVIAHADRVTVRQDLTLTVAVTVDVLIKARPTYATTHVTGPRDSNEIINNSQEVSFNFNVF